MYEPSYNPFLPILSHFPIFFREIQFRDHEMLVKVMLVKWFKELTSSLHHKIKCAYEGSTNPYKPMKSIQYVHLTPKNQFHFRDKIVIFLFFQMCVLYTFCKHHLKRNVQVARNDMTTVIYSVKLICLLTWKFASRSRPQQERSYIKSTFFSLYKVYISLSLKLHWIVDDVQQRPE